MMITEFDSRERVKELISGAFLPKVRTNSFISDEDYYAEAAAGRLSAVRTKDSLFFIRERDGYSILNFYMNSLSIPDFGDKPVVTEITFRPNRVDDALCEAFCTAGYGKILERVRLCRAPGESEMNGTDGVIVSYVGRDRCEEVAALFADCFDRVTGCLPNVDELICDSENGQLFCVADEKGVQGALQIKKHGTYTEISHLAVRKDMRGRKISEELIAFFLRDTGFKRSFVWTGKDNAPALNAYKRFGFVPDGYSSAVYMKGNVK